MEPGVQMFIRTINVFILMAGVTACNHANVNIASMDALRAPTVIDCSDPNADRSGCPPIAPVATTEPRETRVFSTQEEAMAHAYELREKWLRGELELETPQHSLIPEEANNAAIRGLPADSHQIDIQAKAVVLPELERDNGALTYAKATTAWGSHFVQVAAFREAANLSGSQEAFTNSGFPVRTGTILFEDTEIALLQLGPFGSRQAAENALTAAKDAGFKDAYVVEIAPQ